MARFGIFVRDLVLLLLMASAAWGETLPIANGGTAAATAKAAVSNVLGNPTVNYYVVNCTSTSACTPLGYNIYAQYPPVISGVTHGIQLASLGVFNPTTIQVTTNNPLFAAHTVSNVRRTCVIDNDTQSATALTAAQFSGKCVVPYNATIVEVDVSGGTQTLTGSATAPTFTGTSSVQIGKVGVQGVTSILSAALATASGRACATTQISQTCIFYNGATSSSTVTLSDTTIAAGDQLYISAATADAAQTWYEVVIVFTVNNAQ